MASKFFNSGIEFPAQIHRDSVCEIIIEDGKVYMEYQDQYKLIRKNFDADELQVIIAKQLLTTDDKLTRFEEALNEQLILAGLMQQKGNK